MIAIRYALMYPASTNQLVLVDPIGLEDWKAKGVSSIPVDQWYERELQTNADKIRQYERNTYYAGTWSDSYEPWVQMLAGMYRGPGKDLVAWNSALLYDMIYTQPVYYELEQIAVPTLLLIGDKDNTAIGKDLAPPSVRAQLGHYPELAKQAVARIPGAKLVEFPDMGHAPQIQNPDLSRSIAERSLNVAFRRPEMNCRIDGRFLNDFIGVDIARSPYDRNSALQTVGLAMENAHLVNFLICQQFGSYPETGFAKSPRRRLRDNVVGVRLKTRKRNFRIARTLGVGEGIAPDMPTFGTNSAAEVEKHVVHLMQRRPGLFLSRQRCARTPRMRI